jgi:hypothetical protein
MNTERAYRMHHRPQTARPGGGRAKKKKNVVGEQKANTNEDRTWNFKQENVVA